MFFRGIAGCLNCGGVFLMMVSCILLLHSSIAAKENHRHQENKMDRYYKKSKFNVPKMIQSYGYPLEIHHVVTEDGYILQMHRIPGPRLMGQKKSYNRTMPGLGRAVYIQHCIFCSSAHFVLNEPHQALAYLLADAGFDVWLGNYRGNVHSRNHLFLSPEETPFWLFSFMEMGKYDVPAMTRYVLKTTGLNRISYIGHSMGTTGFFAALALYPKMNDKIDVMAAMAPVIYMDNTIGPFRESLIFAKSTFRFWERVGKAEAAPMSATQESLVVALCSKGSPLTPLCQAFLTSFSGDNRGYIDGKHLPAALSHMPSGTSIRTAAHLGQLMGGGRFSMFDMGPKYNLHHYGSVTPPEFNIKNVRVPVGIFWSANDYVAAPKDVARAARDLPNVIFNYEVPQKDFNHLDFLFADTARRVLYDTLIRFLINFESYT